ncbi:hypothetical protein RvY_07061 [Ramazzottius varieornatus]|uniref:Uncharacterized protein n=1 Tax=Ramazzottius varieornatus TaxID=947166 RepID=A0A1D1V412_RAMVA|nr:hypothetical protein RvY_07061 [Ramazzottius varieornatus]
MLCQQATIPMRDHPDETKTPVTALKATTAAPVGGLHPVNRIHLRRENEHGPLRKHGVDPLKVPEGPNYFLLDLLSPVLCPVEAAAAFILETLKAEISLEFLQAAKVETSLAAPETRPVASDLWIELLDHRAEAD